MQKFINRFPSLKMIISDNGRSFVRAAQELKLLFQNILDKDVKNRAAKNFSKWGFITPNAPWFGGWYERQVRSIKRPLRKILGSAVPHFRDLEVIVSSIEAMVNSRPLCAVSSGEDDPEALCPADLLYGYRGSTLLPQQEESRRR